MILSGPIITLQGFIWIYNTVSHPLAAQSFLPQTGANPVIWEAIDGTLRGIAFILVVLVCALS